VYQEVLEDYEIATFIVCTFYHFVTGTTMVSR